MWAGRLRSQRLLPSPALGGCRNEWSPNACFLHPSMPWVDQVRCCGNLSLLLGHAARKRRGTLTTSPTGLAARHALLAHVPVHFDFDQVIGTQFVDIPIGDAQRRRFLIKGRRRKDGRSSGGKSPIHGSAHLQPLRQPPTTLVRTENLAPTASGFVHSDTQVMARVTRRSLLR